MYPIDIQLISKYDFLIKSLDIQRISIKDILYVSRCHPIEYPRMISLNIQMISLEIQMISIQFSSFLPDPPATAAGIDPTMCTRLDYPSGNRPAHLWPHGTTFVRARSPLRQVLLLYPRCQVSLLLQLGCCHGP